MFHELPRHESVTTLLVEARVPGAPRPLVHLYVSCTGLVSGSIPHVCNRADAPHRLLVCVLKKHTLASTYVELARRADARTSLPHGSASRGRYAIIPLRTA
jgi:hypothetical protein